MRRMTSDIVDRLRRVFRHRPHRAELRWVRPRDPGWTQCGVESFGMRDGMRGGMIVLAVVAHVSAPTHAELGAALELVPKDATAAFVVPSLKRCSDELAACLERVDRAEALLVGRPIALVKARLGIVGGVRDDGALIGVLRPPLPAGAGARAPGSGAMRRTILVPVTDPEGFVAGNFDRETVPGLLRRPDGTLLHGAVIERGDRRWLALSETAAGVAGLAPDAEAAEAHRARLGSSAERILNGTDVIAWVTGAALEGDLEAARAAADQIRSELRGDGPMERRAADDAAAKLARSIASSITVAAFAWDIDALGLLGRGVIRVEPTSELGGALAGGAAAAARNLLDRLPDALPYWALGIDLEGLGGSAALDALTTMLGVAPHDRATIRHWIGGLSQAQFAAYPSRLGVAVGGLLNDSALVLLGPDPTALHATAIGRLEALAGERPGLRREFVLERGRPLKDAGSADAFELKETALPGGNGQAMAIWSIARSILFGSRGVHGLVGTQGDAVVMTFSQRPDVWRRAGSAAAPGPAEVSGRDRLGDPLGNRVENRLGDGAVIAAMREFGLDRVDVEAILGTAQLARVVKQIGSMITGIAGAGAGPIPDLDFGAEPIYVALDVDDHQIHGAVVVPSGVVGVFIDLVRQSRLGR